MQAVKTKRLHIEALRVIACFFVIFNHSQQRGYFLFSAYPQNSPEFWLYMALSVFCKFSVPMFFAISGALLLTKDESLSVIYKKRVFRN